jgi:hypothetical protein
MWVKFSCCRRRRNKTPWLGKDVILVILHQAATDYETFCNVRLVAKWVAQTMDIVSPQASHPSQVEWRHMVEDAALARVSAHVKTGKDVLIFETRGTRNFPILPWHKFEVNARIKFIRQDNDSLNIVRKEWMYSDDFFAKCRNKRCFKGRSTAGHLRLASKIRLVDGCYYISVERDYRVK